MMRAACLCSKLIYMLFRQKHWQVLKGWMKLVVLVCFVVISWQALFRQHRFTLQTPGNVPASFILFHLLNLSHTLLFLSALQNLSIVIVRWAKIIFSPCACFAEKNWKQNRFKMSRFKSVVMTVVWCLGWVKQVLMREKKTKEKR